MPFQPGNKGGGKRKEKLFFDALMLALKDEEKQRGLRVIASKLLELAAAGDMQAIKEVANRLDGMPTQSVEATIETTRFVARLPEPVKATDEWLKRSAPKSRPKSQTIQ